MPRSAKGSSPSLRAVFAKNVRYARIHAGFSQESFALAAGVDRTLVSAIERGVRNTSLDNVERIAGFLEIPGHELLDPALAQHRGFDTTVRRAPRTARLYAPKRAGRGK
jgi:transcriptional regulator with XRE-family HTH domain